MKAKLIFIGGKTNEKPNNPKPKKLFFRKNFRDWFLGEQYKLMRRALMCLNLFGHQAVGCKLKKGVEMHFQ